MITILRHIHLRTVSHTLVSEYGSTTYFFPVRLFVGWTNPFNPDQITRPWCSIIPAGGFHFLGLRVHWSKGAEITSLRQHSL